MAPSLGRLTMSGFGIVTSILTSPAAQKIDFYLGSVHVDGEGLRKVAKLVFMKVFGGKGIGVVEEPQPVGAGASYDTKKDYFSMPPTAGFGSTPVDRYYILHEAVHAMQDA